MGCKPDNTDDYAALAVLLVILLLIWLGGCSCKATNELNSTYCIYETVDANQKEE